MDILFEKASRLKLRFPTQKGELTVEDLWDMPLQSKNGFDLDTTAKTVNRELKAMAEESFVETRANPAKSAMELRLDIVKHVIVTKQKENQENLARAGKKAERERLLAALEDKQAQKLSGMSEEEIKARIAEIDA
jgi:hypothetical protein